MIFRGGFSQHTAANGVVLTVCDALAALGSVTHAFTTRIGGVSEGAFASMNLTVSTGDRAENVRANLERLLAALPHTPQTVCLTHQVHKDRILRVTAENAGDFSAAPPECDGLVTAERGHLLLGKFADCVPILLADRRSGACAVVHAGWRGTVADIAAKGARALCACADTAPADLIAAIGPSIGPCCFLTHDDVADPVRALCGASAADHIAPAADGRWHIDLKGINAARLEAFGVGEIHVCTECTCCLPERYYSHRRTGLARGSLAAVIQRN